MSEELKAEYKDMFGRDIKVGDYIVYAGAEGRSSVLRAGQVVALTMSQQGYNKVPKIRCKSWSYFNSKWSAGQSGRQKDVSLEHFSRIVVVPKEHVSEKIKGDLADKME